MYENLRDFSLRIKFVDGLVGYHNFGGFKTKKVTPYPFLLLVSVHFLEK